MGTAGKAWCTYSLKQGIPNTTIEPTMKGTTHMLDRLRTIQKERAEGHEGGFTLIELLIVIVVLGILAAVTVFALTNVTAQSAVAACKADAKSVEVATEAYRAQKGVYPPAGMSDLTTGAAYLRSAPGGGTHYVVTLVAGTGVVNVQSLTPAIGATSFDGAVNPCDAVT